MPFISFFVCNSEEHHNTKVQRTHDETVYSNMDDSFLILFYNTQGIMNYTKGMVFALQNIEVLPESEGV
jgi:hypothetical protein